MMTGQFNFFENRQEPAANVVEGFRYASDFISPSDEEALVRPFQELTFREFQFHGYPCVMQSPSTPYRDDLPIADF
jgi:hypothetical protein